MAANTLFVRRFLATAWVCVCMSISIVAIWTDSFAWELLKKSLALTPSRVSQNWPAMIISTVAAIVAFIVSLKGRRRRPKRLLLALWDSFYISAVLFWSLAFFYSVYLEQRQVRASGENISPPPTPRLPVPPIARLNASAPSLSLSLHPLDGIQVNLQAANQFDLSGQVEYEMTFQNVGGSPGNLDLMIQLPAPFVVTASKIVDSHGAVGSLFKSWPEWTAYNGGIRFRGCPASLNYRLTARGLKVRGVIKVRFLVERSSIAEEFANDSTAWIYGNLGGEVYHAKMENRDGKIELLSPTATASAPIPASGMVRLEHPCLSDEILR